MAGPEVGEEFFVADDVRVVVDRYGFGVVAEAVVGRVLFFPAAVADAGAQNALDGSELGVGTPESPHAEGGGLEGDLRGVVIEGKGLCGDGGVLGDEGFGVEDAHGE